MTDSPDTAPTLLVPKWLGPDASPSPSDVPRIEPGQRSHGLPTDLAEQATSRFQAMALLYAGVFFMAGFFPSLLFDQDRADLLGNPINWVPGTLSIAIALAIAVLLRNPRLSRRSLQILSVSFHVASCYGIAGAEFLQPRGLNLPGPWIGLSWVAVWMLLFTIVVPSTPRRSLFSSLAASTSVPVMVAISIRVFPPMQALPNAFAFFFVFIFPYLLVVSMAYVGARVISALGNEVRKARQLGSYVLLERIGVGGMGEVWRARHRLLARPAAIKLIRPSATVGVSEPARRRFEREAQAIASLRSPHTIDLFDFGVAADGTFYYVMELLEGLDAERLIKAHGPLPAGRVVQVIRQVCHSLSEAESVGLVHRDIKPANVILCRYGEDFDFVKVLDFGIVKALHEPGLAETGAALATLTMEPLVQGTPAFMAPEQALESAPVDNRADIYATGCLAYWLLTGQLVFTGDTPVKLLLHHAQSIPDPPSARTEMVIPPELDALVLSCLAKNPADRPQTARELIQRLDGIRGLDGWTAEEAKAWWQAHLPA